MKSVIASLFLVFVIVFNSVQLSTQRYHEPPQNEYVQQQLQQLQLQQVHLTEEAQREHDHMVQDNRRYREVLDSLAVPQNLGNQEIRDQLLQEREQLLQEHENRRQRLVNLEQRQQELQQLRRSLEQRRQNGE